MNIVRIICEVVVALGLLYIIWFTCFIEKLVNTFRKNQSNLLVKNVENIGKVTSEAITRLSTEKQSLEENIATVTQINERLTKTKKIKTIKQQYDNRA